MRFAAVRAQLDEVFRRAIESGLSIRQNFPSIHEYGDIKEIGLLRTTAIALRDVPYLELYSELASSSQFHLRAPDGGLFLFQYTFKNEILVKHRLAFFPCPHLPALDDAPELYRQDELYGELVAKRLVRFPIRFDFDPANYAARFHPHSHLTLGQYENCRIPVSRAVGPNSFFMFVVRNFYHLIYRRHMNKFERRVPLNECAECITDAERQLAVVMM